MKVKQTVVMHLTTAERMWTIVLTVAGMTVLGEAVLPEVDEGVMTLDEAVKVLGEVVLKLYESVEVMMSVAVMMDVILEGGLVVPDESVMAVLSEVVLEELSEVVLEELDEAVI